MRSHLGNLLRRRQWRLRLLTSRFRSRSDLRPIGRRSTELSRACRILEIATAILMQALAGNAGEGSTERMRQTRNLERSQSTASQMAESRTAAGTPSCQSARKRTPGLACKRGSDALLVTIRSLCADDAGLEQIEFSSAIHLALDELELADLTLGLTVRPTRRDRGAHRGFVRRNARCLGHASVRP
jgi:hypothetical protein